MQGLTALAAPIIHPSGYATKYYYSGDPVTNSGWIQSAAGEQRFLLSSGPVDVPPGDTQVVTITQIIDRGSSNIQSISVLRQHANFAREFYYDCYGLDPVGINENTSIAEGFSLSQNYPNPFNPVTIISYKLPVTSYVTLKIFDALGKEVATLVGENQNSGSYNYQLSTVNYQLSSGIYFYSLAAGDFKETRRMILLK
jgi:hypothetical protein